MSDQPETAGEDAAINLADPHQPMTIDSLHAMLQARSNEKPKEYVPPPRTDRQMTQLEEELEAGRRRVAFNEAQAANRPQLTAEQRAHEAKINGNNPTNTVPVMRPADGAGSKEQNAKQLKG